MTVYDRPSNESRLRKIHEMAAELYNNLNDATKHGIGRVLMLIADYSDIDTPDTEPDEYCEPALDHAAELGDK